VLVASSSDADVNLECSPEVLPNKPLKERISLENRSNNKIYQQKVQARSKWY